MKGNGKDEIALLNMTFNNMLDRLEIAFKMQNFIANASHELRTPLTAITGQLEVILLKNRNKQRHKETIESVLDDIKTLTAFQIVAVDTRKMSLPSLPAASLTPVRIDDVVWQARGEFMKRNPSYKIDVVFDPSIDDENSLIVNCNEQLIKTAIINPDGQWLYQYSEPHEVTLHWWIIKKIFLLSNFRIVGLESHRSNLNHILNLFTVVQTP
ncbi:MAG: histidine kinase dimerization/phospho-acceptor domain-containing protein [Bacteroidales bacterium]